MLLAQFVFWLQHWTSHSTHGCDPASETWGKMQTLSASWADKVGREELVHRYCSGFIRTPAWRWCSGDTHLCIFYFSHSTNQTLPLSVDFSVLWLRLTEKQPSDLFRNLGLLSTDFSKGEPTWYPKLFVSRGSKTEKPVYPQTTLGRKLLGHES